MKRRICFGLAMFLLVAFLGGCQLLCRHRWQPADCEHPEICEKCGAQQGEPTGHRWTKATCEVPKTCALCGKTEGTPRGHIWQDATCENAKYCVVCKEPSGDPLGHDWIPANCTDAATCSRCGVTEGTPLYHQWQAATTETPKTCTLCGKTMGDALRTDPRFTTEETLALQGTWQAYIRVDGAIAGVTDFPGCLKGTVEMKLDNRGIMTLRTEPENLEEFKKDLADYATKLLYDTLAADGVDRETAKWMIELAYGMTPEEYAQQLLKEKLDVDALLEEMNGTRVYYAQGDTLYIAEGWEGSFWSSTYHISGDTLVLEELCLEDPNTPIQWKRID